MNFINLDLSRFPEIELLINRNEAELKTKSLNFIVVKTILQEVYKRLKSSSEL